MITSKKTLSVLTGSYAILSQRPWKPVRLKIVFVFSTEKNELTDEWVAPFTVSGFYFRRFSWRWVCMTSGVKPLSLAPFLLHQSASSRCSARLAAKSNLNTRQYWGMEGLIVLNRTAYLNGNRLSRCKHLRVRQEWAPQRLLTKREQSWGQPRRVANASPELMGANIMAAHQNIHKS